MKTCTTCKREFPADVIRPFLTIADGIERTVQSCPICALKQRNEIHGLPPKTPFHGGEAKRLHKRAVAWLKQQGAKP